MTRSSFTGGVGWHVGAQTRPLPFPPGDRWDWAPTPSVYCQGAYGGAGVPRQAEGAVPYQTRALEVLAQWRAVERALADADAGTPESDDLRAEALRLRDAYQGLILAARHNDAPEPPPFPLDTEPLA